MTPNNNLSCLPFYDSVEEQSNRRTYAYGQVYPLYCGKRNLPPFQIRINNTSLDVYAVNVFRKDGSGQGVITLGAYIKKCVFSSYVIFVYDGSWWENIPLEEGQYFLQIDFRVGSSLLNQEIYYSEVFTVVGDRSLFTKIEFWDSEDFIFDDGRVVYANAALSQTYKNVLYLPTELGMPEYTFNEEGEERDGFFFVTKQLSEKMYRFVFLAPEYLCDVLRLARVSRNVIITDNYGREYTVNHFSFEVKWQAQGYLASVECEFRTDTVLKQLGRGY